MNSNILASILTAQPITTRGGQPSAPTGKEGAFQGVLLAALGNNGGHGKTKFGVASVATEKNEVLKLPAGLIEEAEETLSTLISGNAVDTGRTLGEALPEATLVENDEDDANAETAISESEYSFNPAIQDAMIPMAKFALDPSEDSAKGNTSDAAMAGSAAGQNPKTVVAETEIPQSAPLQMTKEQMTEQDITSNIHPHPAAKPAAAEVYEELLNGQIQEQTRIFPEQDRILQTNTPSQPVTERSQEIPLFQSRAAIDTVARSKETKIADQVFNGESLNGFIQAQEETGHLVTAVASEGKQSNEEVSLATAPNDPNPVDPVQQKTALPVTAFSRGSVNATDANLVNETPKTIETPETAAVLQGARSVTQGFVPPQNAEGNALPENRREVVGPAIITPGEFGLRILGKGAEKQGQAQESGKNVKNQGDQRLPVAGFQANLVKGGENPASTFASVTKQFENGLPEFQLKNKSGIPSGETPFLQVVPASVQNPAAAQEVVTPTAVQNPREVIEQIVQGAHVMVRDGATEMQIRLHPEELGRVELKIVMDREGLQAHFLAESETVKALIETSLPQLKNALQQSGLQADNFSVSVGGKWAQGDMGGFSRQQQSFQETNFQRWAEALTNEEAEGYEAWSTKAIWQGQVNITA